MKKEIIYFIIAFILFSIVAVDIYWWIQISSDFSKSLDQAKREYHEKFPCFIGKGHSVAILNILLLSVAAFLFYKAQTLQKIKLLSKIFFVISIVLIAWQVFSLM